MHFSERLHCMLAIQVNYSRFRKRPQQSLSRVEGHDKIHMTSLSAVTAVDIWNSCTAHRLCLGWRRHGNADVVVDVSLPGCRGGHNLSTALRLLRHPRRLLLFHTARGLLHMDAIGGAARRGEYRAARLRSRGGPGCCRPDGERPAEEDIQPHINVRGTDVDDRHLPLESGRALALPVPDQRERERPLHGSMQKQHPSNGRAGSMQRLS